MPKGKRFNFEGIKEEEKSSGHFSSRISGGEANGVASHLTKPLVAAD